MIVCNKSTIKDTRYILVVLTAEEKAEYHQVEFSFDPQIKWWHNKLVRMGAWVTKVLTVHQVKEGDQWTNNFKRNYPLQYK